MYKKIYRRNGFVFQHKKKLYSTEVINVTFKYSNKAFNQIYKNTYIKFGFNPKNIKFDNGIALHNNEVVGIEVNKEVIKTECELPEYFTYENGMYQVRKNIPTLNTVDDLRFDLYKNGFICNGQKYVRWKRSSGSARVGKCLFINEKMYKRMHKWEMCGLKIKEGDEIDLAALESYISLTSSSIIDTLKLNPENILLIQDYDSIFNDDVIVTYNENGKLKTTKKNIKIINSIWDGQSLIDSSLLPIGKSMALLRNLFFKSCCFSCNIQDFFKDYNITEISQLNGQTRAKKISDIKLITTPNSIKYLKFGSFDEWLNNIEENFGIVKYDKKTHYFDGKMVQTHYQLLNTLQMSVDDVKEFLKPTFNYIDSIKNDPAVLRYHIKYAIKDEFEDVPAACKKDIIYKLLSINDKFAKTKIYNDFKKNSVIKPFINNLRKGHVLVNGNYSTLCGNPVEMLLHSIGKFTGESIVGIGNVHSLRFKDNVEILGSRSPHVCQGNILIAKNKRNKLVDKYLNISEEIVVVNSIGENLLQRLSGSDFDSDTVMLTDNNILLKAAKKNYKKFLVPTCNVTAKKIKRKYTNEDKCDLDIKTSKNLIGQIVNLSQELNSLLWDLINNNRKDLDLMELYYDICQLDVMSGIEIDSAKKEFDIDNSKELNYLRKKYLRYDQNLPIKPMFFKYLAKQKGYYIPNTKSYLKHDTTMDYLQYCINSYQRQKNRNEIEPFYSIIDDGLFERKKVKYNQVNKFINTIRQYQNNINKIYALHSNNKKKAHDEVSVLYEEMHDFIGKIKMSPSTIIYLLRLIENEEYSDINKLIFYTLFKYANESLYDVIIYSGDTMYELEEDIHGDVQIYDILFKKIQK